MAAAPMTAEFDPYYGYKVGQHGIEPATAADYPSPDPPRTPAAPRCNDGYPTTYTVAGGYEDRRCELATGHEGYHQWQNCQWPLAPYGPSLPPDQMTALERQLTQARDMVVEEREAWKASAQRWQDRAERAEAAIMQTWRPEVKALGIYVKRLQAERDQMRAVVEAARKDAADIGRFHYLHVIPALDALDGSHAAQDETHSRL